MCAFEWDLVEYIGEEKLVRACLPPVELRLLVNFNLCS